MSSSTEHPSILNVDADKAGRLARSRLLREAGYAVREAGSGEEVLESAKREAPDLILLKVNLSGLGGFETARRLKADPATEAVPVLMLSADAAESSAAAGDAERLAEVCLTEPVERSALLATVKALLRAGRAEQARRETKAQLEARVKERTAELERVNRTLRKEIAERQRAEESVKAERQRFNDVLDTLPAYLVLLTPDYHVPFANRFFRERFGESLGRRCFEYLFQRSEPCETCETYNALKSMAPYEWEWTGPDGRNYYIYDFPFTDTDGSTLIMEVGLDITARKRIEEELRRYQEHLEKLVEERTADLARRNAQLAAEIAERERAEQALRESEEFNRRIIESSLDCIKVLDLEGKLISMSPGGQKLLEIEDIRPYIGGQWIDFWKGSDHETALKAVARARAGNVGQFEGYGPTATGAPKWWDVLITPIMGADGQPKQLLAISRDITARRQAEDYIKRNEARLESLLRIAQLPAGSSPELLDFALNEAIALTGSKIGYIYHYDETRKEFTLNTWSKEVMSQCTIADQQTVYQLGKTGIWGEAVRQAKPIIVNDFQAPNPLKKGYPDGHAPLYKYMTVPVFSNGRILGVVGVANKETDYDAADVRQLVLLMDSAWKITERKQAEQERERLLSEISRQRALLDGIVENTEAHLVYLDRDFNFLRVNAAYAKACRRAPEEFIGHNHFEFYPHEENEAIFRRVRDTGEPFEIKEKPFVFPDMPERGTTYWDWTLTPIKHDEGEVEGLVFALTEVTEQVQAREQLLAAERARAQLAESLNAEISHRVKNNLAMVAGLLQVEIMEQSDPKVITALHDAAARLLTFAGIHELMQAGHAEEIDLLAAARQIAEATRYVFAGGKMDLRVQGETICYSSRAATNVAVVINELITNAAKHGAPSAGGLLRIELQIELQQGRLHLAVWNSGNPIAAGFEVAKQKNMGLRMVREIVMNQYDGSFSLRPQDGGTLAEVTIADARLRQ